MPYPNERASGEVLMWLENSQALKDFKGIIQEQDPVALEPPTQLTLQRREWLPRRMIAIDGSNITSSVKNGFPGAEVGLITVAVIVVKLENLRNITHREIPPPSFFRDMENAHTIQKAVPGIGVLHRDVENDTPLNFFRRTVKQAFDDYIDTSHEPLSATLHDLLKNHAPKKDKTCPVDGCDAPYDHTKNKCPECNGELYRTDLLRLHEYFNEVGSCGDAHGRLRSILEIISLINILRYFEREIPERFKDTAFVLDGPLAVFGTPASILHPIRKELLRLNKTARAKTGQDIALFGVEKSGAFYEHWEQIDWDDENGPRTKYPSKTIITPNGDYVRKNIVPGTSEKSNPHGNSTHFGRHVLYKTAKGEHVVLNTAMLNDESQIFSNTGETCYPRLGDILDIMDQLATHLYRDGFMPLVRAHANAAIPIKRGTDIIRNLMEER